MSVSAQGRHTGLVWRDPQICPSLCPGEHLVTSSLQSPEELYLSVVPLVLQAQASTPLTTGSDLLTPFRQAALPSILPPWDRQGRVSGMRTSNGTATRT